MVRNGARGAGGDRAPRAPVLGRPAGTAGGWFWCASQGRGARRSIEVCVRILKFQVRVSESDLMVLISLFAIRPYGRVVR